MKVTLPIETIISPEFQNSLTALCRAKGVPYQSIWPLAELRSEVAHQSKLFDTLREELLAKHGLCVANNMVAFIDPADRPQTDLVRASAAFASDLRLIASTAHTFSESTPDAGSVTTEQGALSADVLWPVMAFVNPVGTPPKS